MPNININGNSFFLPEKTTVSIVNNFSNVLKASLFIASPRTTIWEHALSDSTFLMIGNLGLIFSRGHSFSADSRFVEYRRRSTSTKARGITKDDVEKFAYRKLLMMACMAIENQALMTWFSIGLKLEIQLSNSDRRNQELLVFFLLCSSFDPLINVWYITKWLNSFDEIAFNSKYVFNILYFSKNKLMSC